jgi:hypothetical protein
MARPGRAFGNAVRHPRSATPFGNQGSTRLIVTVTYPLGAQTSAGVFATDRADSGGLRLVLHQQGKEPYPHEMDSHSRAPTQWPQTGPEWLKVALAAAAGIFLAYLCSKVFGPLPDWLWWSALIFPSTYLAYTTWRHRRPSDDRV